MVNTLIQDRTPAYLAVRRAPLALALISVKLVLRGSTSETHFAFSVAKERRSKEMHVWTVALGAWSVQALAPVRLVRQMPH